MSVGCQHTRDTSPAACMSSPLCVRNGGDGHLMLVPQTLDAYKWISLTIWHVRFGRRAAPPAAGFQPARNWRPLFKALYFICFFFFFFFKSSSGWRSHPVVTDRPALSSLCRRRGSLPIVFRLRGNYKVAPSISAGAVPAARRGSARF